MSPPDPEAMRVISGGRPLTGAEADAILQRTRAMWDDYGYGPWAAVGKRTGAWIGRIGLNLLPDWPGPDKWEVGFELAPEYWGHGLATEGARAAIRFGWTRTPLTRIISVTARPTSRHAGSWRSAASRSGPGPHSGARGSPGTRSAGPPLTRINPHNPP